MTTNYGAPSTVTAAEISRNFGQWQDRAMSGPVVVTHHGRARVVMVSAEQYAQFERGGAETPSADQAATEVALSAIVDHMSEGFFAVDERMTVTSVNGVYAQQVGLTPQQCLGRPRSELVAGRDGVQVVDTQLQRVLRTGETVDFIARAPSDSGRFYTIRAFPYPGGAAALFLNKTVERSLARQLQDSQATERAMAALGDIAMVRLSIRGLIASASKRICEITELSAETLLGCRLTDLIRPRDRAEMNEAVERVMKQGGDASLETTLLTRTGHERAVRVGLAGIDREMFTDGVCVLFQLLGDEEPRSAAASATG